MLLRHDTTHPVRRKTRGAMSTIKLFVDDPAEIWCIGHELSPGRRLATVNHEDEDELDPGS
jgi:hypothetical protein